MILYLINESVKYILWLIFNTNVKKNIEELKIINQPKNFNMFV